MGRFLVFSVPAVTFNFQNSSFIPAYPLSKGPKRLYVSPPSPEDLRTETDPVSEKPYSLVFRILDDEQSPKNSVILTMWQFCI
jgi:hypothetical protein